MTTVLRVEDDDAIRNNVACILKLRGATSTWRRRQERAGHARPAPEGVISDINMPGTWGTGPAEFVKLRPAPPRHGERGLPTMGR